MVVLLLHLEQIHSIKISPFFSFHPSTSIFLSVPYLSFSLSPLCVSFLVGLLLVFLWVGRSALDAAAQFEQF
jgi:hypothetical protein